MRHLFLTNRLFLVIGAMIVLFVVSFFVPPMFPFVQAILLLAIVLVIVDINLIFHKNIKIKGQRIVPKILSMGDPNVITLQLQNLAPYPLFLSVIDELPFQLQLRDFEKHLSLTPQEEIQLKYEITPFNRGEYNFGNSNIFASSTIGLIQRRIIIEQPMNIPVYPSILQMKQYELKAFDRTTHLKGIKKIRRIGHSYEFEQIKNYVRGDDYRSINWKASSRKGALMVNQYEDERAQQVYCIIDKSRNMRMPFLGLSLLDYAINTSLVISNIALQKHDKAGLITFSDKIGTTIKADSKPTQLNKLLLALYKEKERPLEANFELIYYAARKLITGRSLLLLYTNFESSYALERALPILRKINNFHLLVVVFFKNTELTEFAKERVKTMEEIYQQTIAQKFIAEKAQMVNKLNQYGIQAILTKPEDLSINVVNKYLELKSRGLI